MQTGKDNRNISHRLFKTTEFYKKKNNNQKPTYLCSLA